MKKYIFLILVGALILRVIAINQSLWLDEAIGALVVKNQGLWQILTEFPKHDNHPPLYYLALKVWSDMFGYSEIALRSLSVMFGVATVYIVFKIAKLFGNKYFPYLAALFLATSPLHIYYSQEARMYSMAAFLASGAVYFFLKKGWVGFSIFLTSLVFTDYVPIFLIPAFWLWGVFKKENLGWWKSFILSQVPALILGILWVPILLIQVQGGQWLLQNLPAWSRVAGGATVKQIGLVWSKFVLGRISFSDKPVQYLLTVLASIPFAAALLVSYKNREKVLFFWHWFLIPLVAGFVISFWFPVFIYFRYLFVLPAFYLLVSWAITHLPARSAKLVTVGVISVNLIGWGIYVTQPSQQREQWRQAVAFVEGRLKGNERVIFSFTEPFAPYVWYARDLSRARGATDTIVASQEGAKLVTKKTVADASGVYYFEYLWELHDPGRVVEESLIGEGFVNSSSFDFPGVGILKYYQKI